MSSRKQTAGVGEPVDEVTLSTWGGGLVSVSGLMSDNGAVVTVRTEHGRKIKRPDIDCHLVARGGGGGVA